MHSPLTPESPVAPIAPGAPMRALRQHAYGASDVLTVGVAERPTAGPGEVVVQVRAAGLDRGTWHLMTGRPYMMRLMGFGLRAPVQTVPGLDVAGVVIETGPGVTRFGIGDAVFGIAIGSLAQYARAREDKLARVPQGATFEQAAVLGVSGITALQAVVDEGHAQPGEHVLVLGASGGVGTYAVQLAKAAGARVTAVCSAQKAELVRGLGADRVLDYRTQDFADDAGAYDLVLDIGGTPSLARLRRSMTSRGRLVFVGSEQGGDWTSGFERALLAFAIAPFVSQRFAMLAAAERSEHLERLAAMYEAGSLRPVIDRSIGVDGVARALDDMEAGRVRGKIAVRID